MRFAAIIGLLGLTACGVAGPAPMPLSASGPTEVLVDGVGFIADLQPMAGGAQIGVSRLGAALALDEGVLAKKVAAAFCAGRGQRLDPAALGAFGADGVWAFDGGCV